MSSVLSNTVPGELSIVDCRLSIGGIPAFAGMTETGAGIYPPTKESDVPDAVKEATHCAPPTQAARRIESALPEEDDGKRHSGECLGG